MGDYVPRHAASGADDPDDDEQAEDVQFAAEEADDRTAASGSERAVPAEPEDAAEPVAPAADAESTETESTETEQEDTEQEEAASTSEEGADSDAERAGGPDGTPSHRVPMAARPPLTEELDHDELDPDTPEFWQEAGGVTAEEFLNLDADLAAERAAPALFDQDAEAAASVYVTQPDSGPDATEDDEDADATARPLSPGEALLIPAAASNRPPRNYGAFASQSTPDDEDDETGGWLPLVLALVAACFVGIVAFIIISNNGDEETTEAREELPTPVVPTLGPIPTPTPLPTATPVPTPTPTPYPGWSDPTQSGQPWSRTVEGLLTFRGNPTRSWYGTGPMPTNPQVQWTYPDGRLLCGNSTVGATTTQWCGTGWTGQPAVFERDDRTWAVFGAYDYGIHFVDADTGENILPTFQTGDIIKGSVTIDPDGFPLVYSGSRDNFLHIVAFDREVPTELWRLSADAVQPQLWNNDWDGSPMVIGDYLFEGGENSVFHIVKLNRGYDADGFVTVNPELVFFTPGWDQPLIDAVGINVSIENSVAVSGNTVYFANSGGLVQGWDITGLEDGAVPQQNFRYWVGDDTDATLVIDDEGFLYVGVEWERLNARSNEVGQLVKLDPSNPDNPLVWSVFVQAYANDGVWATPAIYKDMVYASSDSGRLLGVDRATGEIIWEKLLPGPVWSSQVVVDDVLLQGDCNGVMHAYDVSDTRVEPPELWTVQVSDGCIESTPAVWGGRIIVGTRAGQVHMISDTPG